MNKCAKLAPQKTFTSLNEMMKEICYFCNEVVSLDYVELVLYGPTALEQTKIDICMNCFSVELEKYYTQRDPSFEENFCCLCKKPFDKEEDVSGYIDFWYLGIRITTVEYTYGEICIPCGVKVSPERRQQ